MNEIQNFNFNGVADVRTLTDAQGNPWFVAKDVCDALDIARPANATRYLDDEEKGVCLVDTTSGVQDMITINESGLYSLILRSRKPEAKAFKKWVTAEVLPAIRKHDCTTSSDC